MVVVAVVEVVPAGQASCRCTHGRSRAVVVVVAVVVADSLSPHRRYRSTVCPVDTAVAVVAVAGVVVVVVDYCLHTEVADTDFLPVR